MDEVKQHDTHAVEFTASCDLSNPQSLRLLVQLADDRTAPVIALDCEVVTPLTTIGGIPHGVVRHQLTGTLEPGIYRVELEVDGVTYYKTPEPPGFLTMTVAADLEL